MILIRESRSSSTKCSGGPACLSLPKASTHASTTVGCLAMRSSTALFRMTPVARNFFERAEAFEGFLIPPRAAFSSNRLCSAR